MITCVLRYTIVPEKLAEFEKYGLRWVSLVTRFGGVHHGYFLPDEGANDLALALFSFPSLSEYERYRKASKSDSECQAAYRQAASTGCVVRYERSFFRPLGIPITLDRNTSASELPG